jgi:hypothetical protein
LARCETKFFQPAVSAAENPLAAEKNKKIGHIQCDSVRFGQILQKRRHSIPRIIIFFVIGRIRPEPCKLLAIKALQG